MAILIECGNERTVDSSASGRRSKCPLEPRLTMRGTFLLIAFPRTTTTTWRAPSRCVAGKRTWGTLILTHLCTHAHNVYILEKIFLFESQLTGLAAQQNCLCSVYFAMFIVVRHPLWSPARPVFLSKGPLHAPQLTAGFVPGAIDDCWYTSFVVSTDNRQATSDGRRATAVQLPLRAGKQQAARTDLPEILVRQQWSYVRERLVSPTPSRPDLLAQLGMNLGEASSFKVRCVGKFAYNKSETAAPAQRKSVD